ALILLLSQACSAKQLIGAANLGGGRSGAVTACSGRGRSRGELFLYKGGIEIRELDAAGDGGEFTIPRARSEPSSWSDPSDIVWIVVTHYSKPSISLCPSGGGGVALGGNITIQCQATQRNMRFLLYKVGSSTTLQDAEPARDLAEFPISNVSRRDAGRYRCYYHTKSDLPIWLRTRFVSPPLTACLFVNPEGSYPKPSISISPGGVIPVGGNVTIWCGHQYPGMRFLLYKAGDGNYLTYTDPVGYVAEFPITSARREHSGSYTCRSTYRTGPAAYSEPSDPVQIIVAGEGPNPAPQLPAPHPWWCCAQNRGVLAPILPVFLTRPHSSPRARNTTRESWPPASPSTTLTTSPHSPPRARDRTQVSLLPALPAEKPGSDWTLETGLACLLLGSRALGPQGLGLIRVSCC
uniref:Ig-like domain-containing protein n=1 Tax=Terrapene triunguis TaxID=2587831 RepID=A0A674K0R0_9SAUR